jgi:hypothetical protein
MIEKFITFIFLRYYLSDPMKIDGTSGESNMHGTIEKYVQNLVGFSVRKRLPRLGSR